MTGAFESMLDILVHALGDSKAKEPRDLLEFQAQEHQEIENTIALSILLDIEVPKRPWVLGWIRLTINGALDSGL